MQHVQRIGVPRIPFSPIPCPGAAFLHRQDSFAGVESGGFLPLTQRHITSGAAYTGPFRDSFAGLSVKRVVRLQRPLTACYLSNAIHFVLGDMVLSQAGNQNRHFGLPANKIGDFSL